MVTVSSLEHPLNSIEGSASTEALTVAFTSSPQEANAPEEISVTLSGMVMDVMEVPSKQSPPIETRFCESTTESTPGQL